jgi:hypothetical protein
MDLSKLPKLSETDKHAPPPPSPETPPPAEPLSYAPRSSGLDLGGQVWLSAILGIVFMLMGKNFASFLIAKLTGQPFHTGVIWQTGVNAGQEVAYYDLQGFSAHTETAIFLFGLSMVLEAVALASIRRNTPKTRGLLLLTLVLTAGMTLYNVILVVVLFGHGITPLLSILVVAFGGYTAITEWQTLQQMQATAAASEGRA